eukprot:764896-Hanusia_phi.AAC.3
MNNSLAARPGVASAFLSYRQLDRSSRWLMQQAGRSKVAASTRDRQHLQSPAGWNISSSESHRCVLTATDLVRKNFEVRESGPGGAGNEQDWNHVRAFCHVEDKDKEQSTKRTNAYRESTI